MARKEANLSCFMLTQQLREVYWDWPDLQKVDLQTARDGNMSPLLNTLQVRFRAANMELEELHGILHDKDDREVWDEVACAIVTEKKPSHVHIVGKFKAGKGGTLEAIAKAAGVEVQYIEKAQKGRYGYDNMIAYLIHAKDEDKAQYRPEDVKSLKLVSGSKSFMEYWAERREDWAKGRAIKTRQRAEESIDALEAKILAGEVTKSQIVLTDQYYGVYARYKRRCDDAFAIYGERRAYKTIQALNAGDFRLSVFFVTGQAGAGKTRFARRFVETLARAAAAWDGDGEPWRICQTAATNPLDDYQGEEILFMDDVRGGSLSASDWLKLLDPYNISPNSARYHNKVTACRCIVITSSKEPLEFFYYTRQIGGDRSEALDQFMRRIQSTVQVIHADDFTTYRIADGQRTEERLHVVPGTGDGAVSVKLSYGFGKERDMDEDGAVVYLVGKVEENSGLIAKNALTDEAAEAAASGEAV